MNISLFLGICLFLSILIFVYLFVDWIICLFAYFGCYQIRRSDKLTSDNPKD
ncbi:MAG: hypothetical protein UU03_C0014G0004 [Candidatus Woesebacteria bacterium GW2011_GWA1_40_45]|uniref:Uncharacterized protein n=1 Tax=Candidatus Woesebacteria bacterium GW2011_GWA1_40_45 TaxID=1618554 RepID=A0A0G0SDW7_9BACT|nr:MAG: hypothetical protein UU03_C0014G0004 [Candidatus Woesebacteria bacterium GW2011_GWA1_40_45]